MIGGQRNGWIEMHCDQDLLSGDGSFAIGFFVGMFIDPVHDGIRRGEAGIHNRRGKGQAAVGAVARRRIYFDIGG